MASRASAAVALAGGDAATAAQQALQAADLADAVGMPVEAALARTIAGRALAELGDKDRAVASSNWQPPRSTAAAPCATATPRSAHCANSASTSTGAPGPATQTMA